VKMKAKFVCVLVALATASGLQAAENDPVASNATRVVLKEELGKGFLPPFAQFLSWDVTYRRLEAMDAAADEVWRQCKTRADYDACRRTMKTKMLAAIGAFPERTPLNARTLGTVKKDGYRVEKIVFESMPGVFVSANLFLPDGQRPDGCIPAVVMSCGHAEELGKDSAVYQRACVLVAKRGMAAFMFDPYEQGERREFDTPQHGCCVQHTMIGLKAMLLGGSMPMLRLWDGLRAVDYVQSRPEIDPDRIGYMGQSGGGTMTALMTAVDDRLKATAPSCYLTSFGYLCKCCGPQDGEQNIFGQLTFGLNHTGYVLIPDTKVCVTGRYSDAFPFAGSAQLFRTVRDLATRLGVADHYAFNFAPGPHGWTESTETASADWMSAWLQDRRDLLPLDMPKYLALDLGFDLADADAGLVGDEIGVTPGKNVLELPGARSIHAVLRERFESLRAARPARTEEETANLVRHLAGIRLPAERGLGVRELSTTERNGIRLTRLAFPQADGLVLPAVYLEGPTADASEPPVLLAAADGRAVCAERAAEALARGARVLVADVTGAGEIGHGQKIFYGMRDTPEEGTSVMLYLMGESMVGHRASDLLFLADWLARRTGAKPRLEAFGSVAVAAAHAFAADRPRFSDVAVFAAPASWTEFLEKPGAPLAYRYTSCVNGALVHYDWTDLLPKK